MIRYSFDGFIDNIDNFDWNKHNLKKSSKINWDGQILHTGCVIKLRFNNSGDLFFFGELLVPDKITDLSDYIKDIIGCDISLVNEMIDGQFF